jgi:hypothetical protein
MRKILIGALKSVAIVGRRRAGASLLALILAAGLPGVAFATVWSSQSAFDAAFPGLTQTNFDGVATPYGGFWTVTTYPYVHQGVTFTTGAAYLGDLYVTDPAYFGAAYPALYTEDFGDSITATFAPSPAVGLLVDEGYAGTTGYLDITAYSGSTEVASLTDYPTNGLDVFSFVGFSGLGNITSVTIDTSAYGSPEFPGIALVESSAVLVPEPSTWAMMLLGFAGLGYAGYRSSRKAASIAGPVIG